jgi:hypothetical protein
MFIPDPDFYPSRISDPRSRILDLGSRIQPQQQKKRAKNLLSYGLTFTVATNITKLKIIVFLNWKRKNVSQLKKNYITFYPIRIQEQGN